MAILKGGFKLDHAGSATGTMFGNGAAGPHRPGTKVPYSFPYGFTYRVVFCWVFIFALQQEVLRELSAAAMFPHM